MKLFREVLITLLFFPILFMGVLLLFKYDLFWLVWLIITPPLLLILYKSRDNFSIRSLKKEVSLDYSEIKQTRSEKWSIEDNFYFIKNELLPIKWKNWWKYFPIIGIIYNLISAKPDEDNAFLIIPVGVLLFFISLITGLINDPASFRSQLKKAFGMGIRNGIFYSILGFGLFFGWLFFFGMILDFFS